MNYEKKNRIIFRCTVFDVYLLLCYTFKLLWNYVFFVILNKKRGTGGALACNYIARIRNSIYSKLEKKNWGNGNSTRGKSIHSRASIANDHLHHHTMVYRYLIATVCDKDNEY